MKKIVLVIILILNFSCKKDKKDTLIKNDVETENKEIASKIFPKFTFILTAKVIEDDRFRLLYTDELGEKFSSKKIIFKKVEGSNDFQTITFELPQEEIYPARLRLNVGDNPNQESIQIQGVEIMHDENKFSISKELFSTYFFPNKYIEHNNEGIINFIKADGKHFPFFVSKDPLHDELISL